jgi:hypothetical protein
MFGDSDERDDGFREPIGLNSPDLILSYHRSRVPRRMAACTAVARSHPEPVILCALENQTPGAFVARQRVTYQSVHEFGLR